MNIIKKLSKKMVSSQGFTLIELMVVIVILGILAGLIIPNIMEAPDEAKAAKAKMDIAALDTALKMYKLHNGTYPTTEQGLIALVERPENAKNWREGGYLEKAKLPRDPWGNDYLYLSPGIHGYFDIISYGADGVADGEGVSADINNWEIE
ncbi:type II secretion system major pseudopilin GspG [Desulfococcaceae bacterium HSG8]|nr:type II secretion system major pseudopilin GspG [Desulfococcaceae bacterium HSG8]